MAQAQTVLQALATAHPDRTFRLVLIETRGDRDQASALHRTDGTGFFTRELELALLDRRIDLAVHSLKDLPTVPAEGLRLAPAVPPREDPRDVCVTTDGRTLAHLPKAARVGTSSLRRRAQLLALRRDLVCDEIRGNVDTRLAKVRDGRYAAAILARAGLVRAGLLTDNMEVLSFDQMLPAPGQGALGLEIRRDDHLLAGLVAPLDHPATRCAVTAERSFLRHVEGGCQAPVAALAVESPPGELTLTGLIASSDGTRVVHGEMRGTMADADALGRRLALHLLAAGADEILAALRRR
jgi:hydroxymethylbilane synthase